MLHNNVEVAGEGDEVPEEEEEVVVGDNQSTKLS